MTEALSGGNDETCTHTARVHSPRMLLTLRSHGCRRRTRTFIIEVQSFASYIKRHASFKMEHSPEIASRSSRYECAVLLTRYPRQMVAGSGYAPQAPVWKTRF